MYLATYDKADPKELNCFRKSLEGSCAPTVLRVLSSACLALKKYINNKGEQGTIHRHSAVSRKFISPRTEVGMGDMTLCSANGNGIISEVGGTRDFDGQRL